MNTDEPTSPHSAEPPAIPPPLPDPITGSRSGFLRQKATDRPRVELVRPGDDANTSTERASPDHSSSSAAEGAHLRWGKRSGEHSEDAAAGLASPPPYTATLPPIQTEGAADSASLDRAEFYPRLLRWIGAGILGVAAVCYLVSGWINGSPLLRTGSFLGFTALLSGAGIFCAYRWREDKGARTFLALATAFLPVNFAQLGALVYAQVKGSLGYSEGLKGVFTFAPVGTTMLAVAGAVSLAVLIPVAFTGFSALARAGAKKMTALFLVANAALLLPWRDPNLVAGLAAVLATGLILADRRWLSRETTLKTWDGVAMRTLLFAPAGLLVVRNLFMHDLTSGLLAFILGAVALLLCCGLPRCLSRHGARAASQFTGYGFALGAWICALQAMFPHGLPIKALALPLMVLPWCLAVFGLSLKGAGRGIAARAVASFAALGTSWYSLAQHGDTSYLPGVLCLLVAVALLLAAFVLEERIVLICGVCTLLVGISYHLHFAFSLVQQNLWISLALAGSSVILASSYLERHGGGLRLRARRLRRQWKGWN
ncbi:MAG: hypothetical protein Q7Q73_01680 [Verrucomicrobiota bacterium JB024]|nr:hypothetical protein [Verrucomicrobiota bacterium JB024]